MTPKEVLRRLKAAGFVELRQKGSHLMVEHPESKKRSIVPMHRGDLKIGTLKAIEKQTGVRLS